MADLLFYCLGAALGTAVMCFPIAFIAMSSRVKFRGKLHQAWTPFGYSVLVLTLGQYVRISSRAVEATATPVAVLISIALSMGFCSLILYFTYRAMPTPAHSYRASSGHPQARPRVDSPDTLLAFTPTSPQEAAAAVETAGTKLSGVDTPAEDRGVRQAQWFRATLLVSTCLIVAASGIAIVGGARYARARYELDRLSGPAYSADIACKAAEARGNHSKDPMLELARRMDIDASAASCQLARMYQEDETPLKRSLAIGWRMVFHAGQCVAGAATLLFIFYASRWVVTGRMRPLWPITHRSSGGDPRLQRS
jgi:hypothetical protein